MGIFNYEEFDYDVVVKTNKGRHEKFKKYKDIYVNKEIRTIAHTYTTNITSNHSYYFIIIYY